MNRLSILQTTLIAILLFCPLLTTVNVALAGASNLQARQGFAFDSWPTFHHDASRTGFAEGIAPHSPRLLWNFTTDGGILGSPVVANGTVFFGTYAGFLYAVNQTTGQLLWKTRVGPVTFSAATVYGDGVYIGSRSGIYRLQSSTGVEIWSLAVQVNSPVLAVDGRIYVSNDTRVYSIYASNGSVAWSFTPTAAPSGPSSADGRVYLGSGLGSAAGPIYALNASTGAMVWSHTLTWAAGAGVTVANGVVYGGGNEFVALNASTGKLIWNASEVAASAPAVAYGRLFFAAGIGVPGVVSLNQTDGRFLWVYRMRGSGVTGSVPAVADGLVFIGGGTYGDFPDPTLYCINAMTGALEWSFPIPPDAANSSPAIANGTVYIGSGSPATRNGSLYAISSANSNAEPLLVFVLLGSTVGFAGFALVVFYRRARKIELRKMASG